MLSHVRQASVRGVDVVWRGWVRRPTRLVELMAGATPRAEVWTWASWVSSRKGNIITPELDCKIFDDYKEHTLPESRAFYMSELPRAYCQTFAVGCGREL